MAAALHALPVAKHQDQAMLCAELLCQAAPVAVLQIASRKPYHAAGNRMAAVLLGTYIINE